VTRPAIVAVAICADATAALAIAVTTTAARRNPDDFLIQTIS
jgi:hypothetical protein